MELRKMLKIGFKMRQRFFIILLIIAFTSPFAVYGQNRDHDPVGMLRDKYRDFQQPGSPTDPKIRFFDADSIFSTTGTGIVQIMIIRHQTVYLPKQRNYTCREARRYTDAYDTAVIHPITFSPIEVGTTEIDSVYCSLLRRSQKTALAITAGQIPISPYPLFNEFKKYPPPLPVVRFPIWTWRLLSTAEWFLGLSQNTNENFSEARNRAKAATCFLEIRAGEDGKVLLVAHGFLNHYLKKYLKKNGWEIIINGGHANLGVTLLVKERE